MIKAFRGVRVIYHHNVTRIALYVLQSIIIHHFRFVC